MVADPSRPRQRSNGLTAPAVIWFIWMMVVGVNIAKEPANGLAF